ncbi:hypothetical protein BO71DRAFT_394991 [Aspergillus ellipticus CBS 707.79]|uniref:Uncharacterized protein n=1 Tax=Aspergillus ellipticus CBS 707.79 TaxID=1448320 RepID=A0A319E5A5_9EURO|nr:hypothetical protein BO71DRAFT_394991 [Aspergillus ellipticus CBS 707.79]
MGNIDPLQPRAFASYIDEIADESTYKIINESLKRNEDKDLTYFTVLASLLIDAKFPPPSLRHRMIRMFRSQLGISLATKIFFDKPEERKILESKIGILLALTKEEAREAMCRWKREDPMEGCYFSYPERKNHQNSHLAELQERVNEVERLLGKE